MWGGWKCFYWVSLWKASARVDLCLENAPRVCDQAESVGDALRPRVGRLEVFLLGKSVEGLCPG